MKLNLQYCNLKSFSHSKLVDFFFSYIIHFPALTIQQCQVNLGLFYFPLKRKGYTSHFSFLFSPWFFRNQFRPSLFIEQQTSDVKILHVSQLCFIHKSCLCVPYMATKILASLIMMHHAEFIKYYSVEMSGKHIPPSHWFIFFCFTM